MRKKKEITKDIVSESDRKHKIRRGWRLGLEARKRKRERER